MPLSLYLKLRVILLFSDSFFSPFLSFCLMFHPPRQSLGKHGGIDTPEAFLAESCTKPAHTLDIFSHLFSKKKTAERDET